MYGDITSNNKLSPFLQSQVPEFVRIDHPTFVSFLEAYYEWLDTQGSKLRSTMAVSKVGDVDTTFDEFVEYFKKQYLLDFPQTLAINQETGTLVNEKTLIKRIKAFYKAKGTEKSFEFLFRILYDSEIEFYYPKTDILRVSDGKWIQQKAIRLGSNNGNIIFNSIGKQLFQKDNSKNLIASADILDVSKFQLGVFEIYELSLQNINGQFSTEFPVEFVTSSQSYVEPQVYSVISSISILNGGSGYKLNDSVIFTPFPGDNGQGAKAKVSKVSSTGKILKIKIENFGVNYRRSPTITINSEKGIGFVGTCQVGAICNFEGYYANADGRLSSRRVIQDSHYYQNYSYVIKSEITIDKYRDILKRLIHPAGLGFFGEVLIKRCTSTNLENTNELSRYFMPVIGHYAPYTCMTYDNLRDWFFYGTGTGATQVGYDPSIDNIILQGYTGTNPIGIPYPNPISSGIRINSTANRTPLKEPGVFNADPFWIIYNHPNKIIKNNVTARIEKDLTGLTSSFKYIGLPESESGIDMGKWDFLGTGSYTGWSEWTMKGLTERNEWASSFTGPSKYAILKYDEKSAFRKLTIRGFLSIPVGDEYDCRFPQGIKNNDNSTFDDIFGGTAPPFIGNGNTGSTGGSTGPNDDPDNDKGGATFGDGGVIAPPGDIVG